MQEKIRSIDIEQEMKSSYLDYAMSVIVSRALPDVRDGLKPVQRRILWAMRDLGLYANRPYRKCAKICGDVNGNYHPHGDAAIYSTLVRMAQDFLMRYPLVEGQGNFGSVDGDPPAAMRYTEARMPHLTEEMLRDVAKDTVDFVPNYDNTRQEPVVLPTLLPNLLVNGSSGIAVGMATEIPPHNLGEVVDALITLLENPGIEERELLKIIPGPDFPTGGIIYGKEGITQAYLTGRGVIKIRAKSFIEEHKGERKRIVISEIPFMVNKTRILESISSLVREKKLEGIADLRDESDKDGLRIVIDLKRGENHEIVLNRLYKHTPLQSSLGIILLALVDGKPQVLTLRKILEHFLSFREEVVRRRTAFLLRQARDKAHILEGLKIALDHIDEIISIIRKSSTVDKARESLIKKFSLTLIQAQAILDMRLQRLTGLERKKVEEDYLAVIKEIVRLEGILSSPLKIRQIIKEELTELKEKFADDRRTEIVESGEEVTIEDLIPQEQMVVTFTESGYIKRLPLSTYRKQERGGKGLKGMGKKDEDFLKFLLVASTHDYLLCFTNLGKVYWFKVYQIPIAGRLSKGKAIVNLLPLQEGEKPQAFLRVSEFREGEFVFMVSSKGRVKQTPLTAFSHPRSTGIIALSMEEGDSLKEVKLITEEDEVILISSKGKAIRFSSKEVRCMGRTARGVRGMTLHPKDHIAGVATLREGKSLFIATKNGYGKRTVFTRFPIRHRGGKGVVGIKVSKITGEVIAALGVNGEEEAILLTADGMVMRFPTSQVREMGRSTRGVRIISLHEGDSLIDVAVLREV
ncbi:MAG: DNA gyrase subunit A [Caldiserica bacterium]|nr:DNA gyrase subunit A [Caldisericota bacterium]